MKLSNYQIKNKFNDHILIVNRNQYNKKGEILYWTIKLYLIRLSSLHKLYKRKIKLSHSSIWNHQANKFLKIINNTLNICDNLDNKIKNFKKFSDHFVTLAGWREMQINSILND